MISLNNVSVKFEDLVVLEKVSFTVNKGEIVHILGPNGSGKTTLVKIMLGFHNPSTGEVEINAKKNRLFASNYQGK